MFAFAFALLFSFVCYRVCVFAPGFKDMIEHNKFGATFNLIKRIGLPYRNFGNTERW